MKQLQNTYKKELQLPDIPKNLNSTAKKHLNSSRFTKFNNNNLSIQSTQTSKQKTLSCKNIFGQAFQSNIFPISQLTVEQYKILLGQSDFDQNGTDISMHIPILSSDKTDEKIQKQQQFLAFKNIKEYNKNEFIKLSQNDPQFQGINFSDFQDGNDIFDQKQKNQNEKAQYEKMKFELSLMHNKNIQNQINHNLMNQTKTNYDQISQFHFSMQEKQKMPKIKSYPIYKKFMNKKQHTDPNKQTAQTTTNAEPEDDDDDQNSLIGNTTDNISITKFKSYKKIKGDYTIYWYLQPDQCTWRPDAREGQTLVVEGKYAYLFGGIGKELYNSIAELDLTNFKWSLIKQAQGNIPTARFGHSCNIYRRNLVIFGGQQKSNQTVLKTRELLQDVFFYNLDTCTWKVINCQGGPLQQRRNHASAIIGRNLLVHGGINSKEQALKDLWILDLVTQMWVEALTSLEFDLCYHSFTPVYHSQRCEKINLYKMSDIKYSKWAANIQYEGLYVFGGKNNKGEVLGDLKMLKTDCKPLQWVKLETKGTGPRPRHSHTQTFSQHYNFLIIYGGQNDNDPQVFYNDMFLLNVDDLSWIKVISNSTPAIARSSHTVCIFDTKFIVFGGINIDGFIPSLLSIGELDPNLAEKKMQEANYLDNNRKKSLKSSYMSNVQKGITNLSQSNEFKNQLDTQKVLVDQLNFQNFKSYLPIPRQKPDAGNRARKQTKLTSFIKQIIHKKPQLDGDEEEEGIDQQMSERQRNNSQDSVQN